MADIRSSVDRPVAIRQHLLAGNNFSGVAPADGGGSMTPTFGNDIYKFDSMTAGGLFEPDNDMYEFERAEALYLVGAEMQLSNQSSWQIERTDVDGNDLVIYSGTTESSVYITEDVKIVLLWGTSLKLTTVGATGAMVATFKFVPYKTSRG